MVNNEKKAPVRQIKFRGLRVDGKGWVYGYLTHTQKHFPPCIHVTILEVYEVIPETVGQFTGLLDKNGKEIYEGDTLEFHAITCGVLPKGYCQDPYKKGQRFFVKKLDSGFTLSIPETADSIIPNQVGHVDNYTFWNHQISFEIIGNIHEESDINSIEGKEN